jgi:hypothetical protein
MIVWKKDEVNGEKFHRGMVGKHQLFRIDRSVVLPSHKLVLRTDLPGVGFYQGAGSVGSLKALAGKILTKWLDEANLKENKV